MIVDDLSETKVTGGISGYLRQKFRELELLDEITQWRLPSWMCSEQYQEISNLYLWKLEGSKLCFILSIKSSKIVQKNFFELEDPEKETD